jgi:heterodisulfide reductase subunit A-like polyferredoxin
MRLFAAALVVATAAAASVDVLVYGGTPSGILAAIGAVGEGMTALLVNPTPHLGGMVTGGLGNTDKGDPAAIGGLALSFFQDICKAYVMKRS